MLDEKPKVYDGKSPNLPAKQVGKTERMLAIRITTILLIIFNDAVEWVFVQVNAGARLPGYPHGRIDMKI
jgi:hypothetical protein